MKNKMKYMYILYLVCLFIFGVCHFTGNINILFQTINDIKINRDLGFWNISLIPFSQGSLNWLSTSLDIALLGDLVFYIPIGLFEGYLSKEKSLGSVLLKCFFICLCFEIFQFVSCLGYFDLTDIIFNLIGCLLGYLCLKLFIFIYNKIEN